MRIFRTALAAAFAALVLASCASTPKGAFVTPVDGSVSSNYGPRKRNFHTGIDVAAPKGTKVVAAQAGKVVFRGRKKRYGRLVIIDHGGGMQTYYAHLSKFHVRKGKKVKRGQVIGRVGKSGRASGHHLHFELRVNGRHTDPRGVVPF
ncbi:M23 family metallopeptidase [Parvularcula sp. ZS-1/3]|uniref:M23 family metallopeptidase n=1 Tax=Parvularcula mediterranea TaxID=2732508 RepID=A0A7Y3W4Q3_9PROT|nr:M23 family metallopeptidase [Parvularcula mediterranea]NNU15995.1 M23 family metallopeptidase [Parvularcula mediterranea]